MSLSTMLPRLSNRAPRVLVIMRHSSGKIEPPTDAPLKIELPGNPKGHFEYKRLEYARYHTLPQFKGNEINQLLFKGINLPGTGFIIKALYAITALWFIGFLYIIYINFDRIEIWVNRSSNEFGEMNSYALGKNFDWANIKDNYWKRSTVIWDTTGTTHNRLPIMEAIQNDMLEESIRRKKEGEVQVKRYY